MKLKLDIPDELAPAILGHLARIIRLLEPQSVEADTDPAPGHPELPLDDPSEADTVWGLVEQYRPLEAGEIIAAGDECEYLPDKWLPVTNAIGIDYRPNTRGDHLPIRRKLTPPPTEQPRVPEVEPDQRDLPWPADFPPPPPIPDGKTKLVYRGTFDGWCIPAPGRCIWFLCKATATARWEVADEFSHDLHHIEAI